MRARNLEQAAHDRLADTLDEPREPMRRVAKIPPAREELRRMARRKSMRKEKQAGGDGKNGPV